VQAVQIAFGSGFDDGPRAGHVAFERRFELFDRVQARFGRGQFACDRAITALQFRHTRGRCFAARAFGRRELALRERIRFETRDQHVAFVEDRFGFGRTRL
jgi:hypothetical protein